jgi:hypothetical protein
MIQRSVFLKMVSLFAAFLISSEIFIGRAHSAFFNLGDDIGDYQLGSEWGKRVVDNASYQAGGPKFQRAVLATVFLPQAGGTAIYLGKFNGVHVVATNHHVCEHGVDCLDGDAIFTALQKKYTLKMWIVSVKEIDLTLMAIDVPPADEPMLARVAQNFAFHRDVHFQEPLLTLGYGGNSTRLLTAGYDTDCRVLSRTAQYVALADPDTTAPSPDRVWSFANGCDISHGDSGSPLISRLTGEILGLIWTGGTPKQAMAKNSNWIASVANAQSAEVWTQLSYGVPAVKMPAALLNAETLDDTRKALVHAIVGAP